MRTPTTEGPWGGLQPEFTWRPSQRRLLEACDEVDDERWHLCAPPGSGKTLVGIELARRLDRRTLVLSPTTAIRQQWVDTCAHFGADGDGAGGDGARGSFAGSELGVGGGLTSVTYQMLGNPGSAAADLRAVARRLWVEELGASDRNAADRIDALEAADPARFRRELNTWIRRVRRTLASDDAVLPAQHLLGERTSELIDRIVDAGYGTVILDECHHLLDWWALVLAELLERLRAAGPVAVIGLTATLPDPDGAREAENYLRLLGEVDVTIPMAALVADGELAPWRDAAWLVTPTPAELAFLDDEQRHLVDDLDTYLRGEEFVEWAVGTLLRPALDDRAAAGGGVAGRVATLHGADHVEPGAWQALWDRDPYVAQALAAWWSHRGVALPIDAVPLAPDVEFDAEARLLLLWQFVHHRKCPDGVREPLTTVLARHGMAFTTGGIRRTRTVNDIVAARSSAKATGAAAILGTEAARRADRLCALVTLEQDRADTPAAVRAAFDDGVGTALRSTAMLCADPVVVNLGVVTVTGRGMWIDALHADSAAARINVESGGTRWVRVSGIRAEHGGEHGVDRVVELVGEGPGWTSAARLDAARRLLGAGVVRVLVSTRALVGEGWNHPALNVLIDLSEAASPAAVTQLRGRAVRLDPSDPAKVASLWDVVVAHEAAPGEWDRARRRHLHWWGPDDRGDVVTGPAKASVLLDRPIPPSPDALVDANARAAAAVADVAATRRSWSELPASSAAVPQLVVRPRSRRSVTARLRAEPARRRWRVGGAGAGAATATVAIGAVVGAAAAPLVVVAASVAAVTLAAGSRVPHFTTRRVDSDDARFWQAVGIAVRDGLDAVGATRLGGAQVSVTTTVHGHRLDIDAGGGDAAVWCAALAEMLGPPGTPRWLLRHGIEVWRVPAAVGATRAAAEAFHTSVVRTIPDTHLLRGGTPEATAALFDAPVRHPDHVDQAERWR